MRRRVLGILGLQLFVLFAAYTLVSLAARRWWIGELAVNWRWQAGWAGWIVVLALLVARQRVLALAALALVGWHLAPALRLSLGVNERADGPMLRVASANVLWRTRTNELIQAWLERERFDLVALQELDRDRLPLLDALRTIYPHQVRWPEAREAWYAGTWGQALLSRHPISRSAIHDGGWLGQPFLEARVAWMEEEIALFGAHPMRPGTPTRMQGRAAAYEALAAAARGERHAILMGDLNATVYSPALADLLAASGLQDSRRGFGRQGTWIASYPILGRVIAPGLRLDLDHVLVGNGFAVHDRRLGPDLGSDHIPVVADLALRAAPRETGARR